MKARKQPVKTLDGRRRKPLSKRELAEIAGVTVETLNREKALGRIHWERDTSKPHNPAMIAVPEAKRWLAGRTR